MVSGRYRFQIQGEEFGGTLYSIAYAQNKGLLFAVCGESIYKDHLVRAFVFNITDQKLLNVFAPRTGTFTRPHDIAVLPNGDEAFVCEIGPNLIWKFIRVYHKSTKKVLSIPDVELHASQATGKPEKLYNVIPVNKDRDMEKKTPIDEDSSGFETSLIIMSLLAIPVLCLVVVTIIVRLRRRGKLQQSYFGNLKGWWGGYRTPHPQDKFNLGNLLNPHKGFDRVSLEESDAEGEEGSDSDVEEYSAVAKKT
ncbi:peptidyl-glycine alpha-amidating monooxygenase-like [Stegodyphus dumicola]|uniref:peptidyl-glycine alpha-amidating monooxygenase-like n=1 Tax=Stegodyphus dumicola TaxID=202533 RepID=UPI0015A85504|nr:peptidyl-glycine alpha-amidating monooxygenase-like [Stegodyphus dumicola]